MAPSSSLKPYRWHKVYQEALIETAPENLAEKVAAVELAIFYRGQELNGTYADAQERVAMAEAAHELLTIKTEKLGWPAILPK